MGKHTVRYLIAAIAVVLLLVSGATIVDQRQIVLVLQMGEVARVLDRPGLYMQIPLLQTDIILDRRVQTLEEDSSTTFTTADHKSVQANSLIRWHITDARSFYQQFGIDENLLQTRLRQKVDAALAMAVVRHPLAALNGADADTFLAATVQQVNAGLHGLQVDSLGWQRITLPPAALDGVIETMRAERKAAALAIRTQANMQVQAIKTEANGKRDLVLADGDRAAQAVKGEGDAEAAAIYNAAYMQDPEFYRFYRSMETYRHSFAHRSDVLVLHTDSELLHYMQPPGKGKP